MRTDTLFYKLFESQPSLLLRLAHLDELADIPYHFQSVELKEKAQRTDGVLLPDREREPSAPLIVCEVQFWEDSLIYTRLVSETSLLLLQMPEYRRFTMILLFRSRSLDTGASSWQALCDSGVLKVVYLDEATTAEISQIVHSPEEESALLLMRFTVSPENRTADDALIPHLVSKITATKSIALQKMFRDLFVSLYVSKYKTLTIQEVRAMIDTREIFDDIHESLAVQQYGEEVAAKVTAKVTAEVTAKVTAEVAAKVRLENGIAMLRVGIPLEQVASILNLPLETLQHAWEENAP
jgi:predicted transposase/invertase (TIGR01784 family)